MESLQDMHRKLLACRTHIEGFYAALDMGNLPDFNEFEAVFVPLAHELQAYEAAPVEDEARATIARYRQEFETLLSYFRGLGPKLELRRHNYQTTLIQAANQANGYKRYAAGR